MNAVWWKIVALVLVAGVIVWFVVLLARMNRRKMRAGAEDSTGAGAGRIVDAQPTPPVRIVPAIRQRW